MPYASVSEVPKYVPKAKRKQWLEVWNSSYKEHGDESRAFAEANAVAGPKSKKLFKFGTPATGFTAGVFGPFKCGNCKFSGESEDEKYHICKNGDVREDPKVTKDSEGNPIIDSNDCCNEFFPVNLEKLPMLAAAKSAINDDVSIFCPLVKVDEAKREVWGVVTAEEPDKDGEICDFESTVPYYEKVVKEMSKATDGANIFPLRAMHGLIAAGKGIGIEFRKESKEVYMGFKVVDDAEWKKVQENVYTGFSQGGRYVKRWKEGDYTRYTAAPGEVSLVDLPCCTRAHFDYVKADGQHEMRKFSKTDPTGQGEGQLPSTPTPVDGVTPSPSGVGNSGTEPNQKNANGCSCSCAACKGGNCAACTAGCECGKVAKAVKYLVNASGEKHLPYTNEDGKPNHRLMGAAWAALHGGYRGNKYEGPDKAGAIKRLKQVYAREGMDTPAEKAERVTELLKGILTDVIQNRAYGQLNKGMYTVARFAGILDDLKYLWITLEYEREQEGDESPVTDDVKEAYTSLLDHLLAYTEEQIEEEKEHPLMSI